MSWDQGHSVQDVGLHRGDFGEGYNVVYAEIIGYPLDIGGYEELDLPLLRIYLDNGYVYEHRYVRLERYDDSGTLFWEFRIANTPEFEAEIIYLY
jgi:hypothetical protein